MIRIRPVAEHDLEPLLALTELTGFGLTTLPKDRELLEQRIGDSLASFERMSGKPRGESYLFVMEDLGADPASPGLRRTSDGRVIGTSGIVSKVGGFEPFYSYKIEISIHESEMLGVRKEIQTLHLVAEHDGPCEIGSLFLVPEYRAHHNGRLLSLSRFLFMAEHRERFDPTVIAEMRGVIDEQGRSPFWDAVGRHFFEIDFPKADQLSLVNKKFIADLMPKHPIYIPLLPYSAQAVIAQVHEQTKPALRLLESEGFGFHGMVDIFEAGPVVSCPRDEIGVARRSRKATVSAIGDEPIESEPYLIATTGPDFFACVGGVEEDGTGGVRLERGAAEAVGAEPGVEIRYAALRALK